MAERKATLAQWTAMVEERDAVVDVLVCALRCAMATAEEAPSEAARLDAAVGRLSIGLVALLVEEEAER